MCNQGRHQVKLRGVLTVVLGTRPPLKNENSSDLGHFKMKISKMRRKKNKANSENPPIASSNSAFSSKQTVRASINAYV